MSYAYYVASITKALRERVLGTVTDAEARSVLEASIRGLAGLADALDADRHLPPPDPALEGDLVHLDGPPENGAVRPRTAAAIATGAERLGRGDWLDTPEATEQAKAITGWERALMRDAIDAMTAMERKDAQPAGESGANPLLIDPAAVERYFRERVASDARVTGFRQAVGGRSRQTVIFTLEGATGLPRDLVIQRDHPAGISPRSVADEYPVLELVAPSAVKSPTPVLLETSRDPLGAPFIVIERLPGSVVGPDYFNPPKVPGLAAALAEQLGLLHRVGYAELAGSLPRTLGPGDSWAAELERLEATWTRLTHWPSITASAAFAWMKRHVHEIGDEAAIIHNDPAFHNILVEDGAISALLDWELVHLGHPAEDLGYCRPFVQEIGEWDDFVAAYAATGGHAFPRTVIDYFSLRALLYLMTLFQNGGRLMFETKVTDDVNLAEVGASFMPKTMLRLANVLDAVLRAD